MASVEQRWDLSTKTLLTKGEQLEQVANLWKEYAETQKELELLLDNVQEKLMVSDPVICTIDLRKLQSEVGKSQVVFFGIF